MRAPHCQADGALNMMVHAELLLAGVSGGYLAGPLGTGGGLARSAPAAQQIDCKVLDDYVAFVP